MTKLAAVADIHCGKGCEGKLRSLFSRMAEAADILLLGGDLTNYGLVEEFEMLGRELSGIGKEKPVVAILGNHDFESGQQDHAAEILQEAGVVLLDGTTAEFGEVGIAGAKGFGGGFGRRALEPWGEPAVKNFVQDAVDESIKLGSALARLGTPVRVVLVHYSPIHATVVGEPEEIMPFLGSSRLEEPIDRYRAHVVFHGHAHHGSHQGHTKSGIPVYNVALPVLKRLGGETEFLLWEAEAAVPAG